MCLYLEIRIKIFIDNYKICLANYIAYVWKKCNLHNIQIANFKKFLYIKILKDKIGYITIALI